jgi:LmbE family N-acetylglucosaminyl deacetylase
MKIMSVHAHFDDYEFTAAGTFELWRRRLGEDLRARVIVCTDGQAGHHRIPRAELGKVRLREQEESARIGRYEFDVLRYPDGSVPREACMQLDPRLLSALWKEIRDFEPDYLFCPPVASDPLAGIHVDHLTVAEAVRRVAFMINVPQAFTPEFPSDDAEPRRVKTPVIINVYDGYMAGANSHHLAVDIEDAFESVAAMAYCHRSQIMEWLPWVHGQTTAPPASMDDWRPLWRSRYARMKQTVGLDSERALELFTVTSWGAAPDIDRLLADIPGIVPASSNIESLRQRLARSPARRSV